MVLEFFYWWYGPGWLGTIKRVGQRIVGTMRVFSMPILLMTLFSPWKRIVEQSDGSFEMFIQSMIGNLVSRAVGFTVRLFVIVTSLILTSITTVFGLVVIIIWPILPIVAISSLVMSIFGGIVK